MRNHNRIINWLLKSYLIVCNLFTVGVVIASLEFPGSKLMTRYSDGFNRNFELFIAKMSPRIGITWVYVLILIFILFNSVLIFLEMRKCRTSGLMWFYLVLFLFSLYMIVAVCVAIVLSRMDIAFGV